MIRRPEQQLEHMAEAGVNPDYNARRPAEMIEQEMESEKKRSMKCRKQAQ